MWRTVLDSCTEFNAREDKIYYYTCKIHDRAARTATVITVKDFSKLRGHKGDHLAISARDGVHISQFVGLCRRRVRSTSGLGGKSQGEIDRSAKYPDDRRTFTRDAAIDSREPAAFPTRQSSFF